MYMCMYMYNAYMYVYVYMYMYILMCVAVSPAPSGREGPDLSNFKEGVSNLGTKVQSEFMSSLTSASTCACGWYVHVIHAKQILREKSNTVQHNYFSLMWPTCTYVAYNTYLSISHFFHWFILRTTISTQILSKSWHSKCDTVQYMYRYMYMYSTYCACT